MITLRISKFQASEKCTVEIDNFEPKDGLEMFIKTFSEYLGEVLLEWNRSWEFGIGRITFKSDEVMLVQSDFPQVFGFDCKDEASAKELQSSLVKFFESDIGQRFAQHQNS